MERTRAWRRHQLRRMKAKAFRKFWKENWQRGLDRSVVLEWAKRSANHLASCSCAVCGNPRRHFKELTMAEKRSNLSFQEQVGRQTGCFRDRF